MRIVPQSYFFSLGVSKLFAHILSACAERIGMFCRRWCLREGREGFPRVGFIYIMFAREGSTGLCWNAVGTVRIGAAPARRVLDDVLWNVLCITIASGVKQ